MTLAPGTRVRFNDYFHPVYLRGHKAAATVIRKQPGEDRYLVAVDNDPHARRFAGGEWCVHALTIEPVEDELTPIDERAKSAAQQWLSRIAPRIEDEARRWAESNTDLDRDFYFALHHPALLWRFYYHLSALLSEAGKGWETVYHQAKDDAGEVEGS